ncbi:uncharacterized protein LOC110818081 [Carica papaya]|uniref:uncharacterized protein LOC110818081 n=1 Tax=Carica papaya TaxID=3649 RepID=UPI000B8CCECC|nr:uncharacterized protein LOC110818081 [Carica papaya]
MDPSYIERDKRVNLVSFAGASTFYEAKNWLKMTEKSFRVLGMTNEQKVILATFMLKGEAEYWWEVNQTTLPTPITWEHFLEVFNAKYFLDHIHHQKEVEFAQLTQESLSVTDYARRFTKLSCYSPEIIYNERKMAQRFQWGLHPKIRNPLVVLELRTYQ